MSDESIYDAIAAVGFAVPSEIVWDGKLHRFATDEGKRYSKDGWYVAHDDAQGKAAAFGSWRDGSVHAWSNGTGRKLSDAEWRDVERQRKSAKAEEVKARDQAAVRATRIYDQAEPVEVSPYLSRKGITCPPGVRKVDGLSSKAFGFDGREWSISGLIVPMRDKKGDIRSLQLIPHDAEQKKKLFMKGGQVARCFFAIGDIKSAQRILVAEGVATAQSAHQATGAASVAAFSAGNLSAVVEDVRAINATADVVVCADDDPAGRKAAESSGCRWVVPGSGCNDFNDLHVAHGLDAVRRTILGDEVDDESWRSELITKELADGTQITPCRVHNLILILRNAPVFRGRIGYNELSESPTLDGEDVDDIGPIRIKAQIEKVWIREKVPTGDVIEALSVVARDSAYHPVRSYLSSLRWDGVDRIARFWSDYGGCAHDAYHQAAARSLFVSAVARAMKPGCKVDLMTILESGQGYGKTKLWPALFGEWCAEVTASLNDKDFFSGLRGLWCADFGELDQFSRADTTRIKQVITMQADHYRPHYGRAHKRFLRQCVFVGGTNSDTWQTDPTGARRFLPIKLHKHLDTEAIADLRDQLWAEAFDRWQFGESWWDVPGAEEHQESSYIGDSWEEVISEWLIGGNRSAATIAQVLELALRIDPGRQTRSDQTRAGSALRRLGWRAVKERTTAGRIAVYRPTS